MNGDNCFFDRGKVINQWSTGDDECDAESYEFECGGVFNHNFMDIVGNRNHDCFWDCKNCKYQ